MVLDGRYVIEQCATSMRPLGGNVRMDQERRARPSLGRRIARGESLIAPLGVCLVGILVAVLGAVAWWNGRTQLARRPDFVRWRSEAVDEVRRQVYERLALVVEAPRCATVRILTNDEVHDPPSYFLSRSTDLFRLQPDRLLSSQDLVQLWLSRATLRFDDTASELVVQSALRKRATLYPWLAVLPLSDEQIRRFLFGAVTMKDRDKSDAARAMLLVCALYFDEGDYSALAAAVAQSSYAHMREAVEAMPDIGAARRQLENERAVGRGERAGAGDEPDHELLARIDDLVAAQGAGSRRLPALGLELLERKLSRRPARL